MIRIGTLLTLLLLPLSMQAATFAITNTGEGEVGNTRTFTVAVVPNGDTVYSVQGAFVFDTSRLDILSVNYASGWLPLTQAGYDSIDENEGSITKTAGYPGGITTTTQFVTVTARLIAPGVATFESTSATQMLDEDSKNTYVAAAPATLTVRTPAPAPTPQVTPVQNVPIESESIQINPNTTQERGPAGQAAAVVAAEGGFTFYPFGLIVITLLIGLMALVGMVIALRRSQ